MIPRRFFPFWTSVLSLAVILLFPQEGCIPLTTTEYLIVVPDDLYAAAAALKTYRQGSGYDVAIVKLSEIASGEPTAEQIDTWIETYAARSPYLTFVALLGDITLLPSFNLVNPESGNSFFSDLRYGIPGGSSFTDYIPKLYVGRIPITATSEMANYIDKLTSFEAAPQARSNMLFFGHQPEFGYALTRDIPLAVRRGFETLSLLDPEEEILFSTLNTTSLGTVFYYGHGNRDANSPLNADNLHLWTDINPPVLYFSGGCDFNGSLELDPALGDMMILATGGSAASIGTSVDGGYGYDYRFIVEILYFFSGSSTVGQLFVEGLQGHYAYVKALGQDVSVGSVTYWFTERMQLRADPALKLH